MIRILLMVLTTIFVGLLWSIFVFFWVVFASRISEVRHECAQMLGEFKTFWKEQ